jgi:hypothetical protein
MTWDSFRVYLEVTEGLQPSVVGRLTRALAEARQTQGLRSWSSNSLSRLRWGWARGSLTELSQFESAVRDLTYTERDLRLPASAVRKSLVLPEKSDPRWHTAALRVTESVHRSGN